MDEWKDEEKDDYFKEIIHVENMSVILCHKEIDSIQMRYFFIHKWDTLAQHLEEGTMLFLGGVHGDDKTGQIGDTITSCNTMRNQVKYFLRPNVGSKDYAFKSSSE